MTKVQLLQERGALNEELDKISSLLATEKRGFNDAERARVTEIDARKSAIEAEIVALDILEKRKNESTPNYGAASNGESSELTKMADEFSLRSSMVAARSGNKTGLAKEMDELAQEEFRASGVASSGEGVSIPSYILKYKMNQLFPEKRFMNATTGADGAFNVQKTVGGIIDVLLPYMALNDLGITRFNGLTGNLAFPKASTQPSAGWNTENGTASEKTPQFAEKVMQPKRLAAFIDVSNQLMMQSSNDVERYILNYLLEAAAIEFEKAAIKGGGSNEPTGIIANTDVPVVYAGGSTSQANGAAMVYADVVNLVKTAMKNNSKTGAFLGNPDVVGKLQLTPKQASGIEGNFILKDVADMLNGYMFKSTTNVPSNLTKGTGTNLSALIFGDFSQLYAGSWGGVEIVKDSITGLKSGKSTLVLNSYTDILVAKPEAFAVIKDAITS
jgi:HK97 family phage major capsid protein